MVAFRGVWMIFAKCCWTTKGLSEAEMSTLGCWEQFSLFKSCNNKSNLVVIEFILTINNASNQIAITFIIIISIATFDLLKKEKLEVSWELISTQCTLWDSGSWDWTFVGNWVQIFAKFEHFLSMLFSHFQST